MAPNVPALPFTISAALAMAALAGTGVPVALADDAPKAAPAAQPAPPPPSPKFEPPKIDLTKEPTLYVVGYAHLDTQWRWSYYQTVSEFIPDTLRSNFKLFEKYPGYVFNFSGSRRYQMMAEYYPEEYAQLKKYVAGGRWFPCGSSVDENDANVPSAESYVRHILYGNRFFRRELGVASDEYMLPDCFGFPACLPTLLTHCGIKGFSTQKLTWGSPVGIPFKVGTWEGPDGSKILAALDPGAYVGEVKENLANSDPWVKRVQATGQKSGVFTDYHYFGIGDQGGAPKEPSVANVQKSIDTKDGKLKVVTGPADWMFKTIPADRVKDLPTYKGELELTEHSAGSISSQAFMKRCNRKNEQLADAAERASVLAWWLGALPYPAQRLEDAWTLVLGSQMHDILPGTSLPRAYEYSWNDELLALNQFAGVLTGAAGAVSTAMDTDVRGTPVLVYNPLSVDREEVVTAPATGAGVYGPDGKPVPSAAAGKAGGVRFLARVPANGWAVYDVRPDEAKVETGLKVSDRALENARYTVTLNDAGDIEQIVDKRSNRKLLSAPARLALVHHKPGYWAAWNMDWKDAQKPPRAYVGGTPTFEVVENGPARVAVRATREFEGSIYRQTISLAAGGAGDMVLVENDIDWTTRETALKAAFPLASAAPTATWDLQAGTITRPNASKDLFEYPGHLWMDLTSPDGAAGVSILNDSKFASDKPDDATLRLTLLYTPGVTKDFFDQGSQDLGKHRITYAVYAHDGDWRTAKNPDGGTHWHAARLNQPLRAFTVPKHAGPLGREFSLARVSSAQVQMTALKKAEEGDEVIVRLRELDGRPAQGVKVAFARPVLLAREVDGQERPIGDAKVEGGALVADVHGYGLKAYAVRLGEPPAKIAPPSATPLALKFDADVVSPNADRGDGAVEPGMAYPAEQFPRSLVMDGVPFTFGPTGKGDANALKGVQTVALPANTVRVDVISARVEGRGETPAWRGLIGAWDTRLWKGKVPEQAYAWHNELDGIVPGHVNTVPVAWFNSHYHTPGGDAHYQYCYLYRTSVGADRLSKGAQSVELGGPGTVVLAATAITRPHDVAVPTEPLYDTLEDHRQDGPRVVAPEGEAKDSVVVEVRPGLYWRSGQLRVTLNGKPAGEPESTVKAWVHDTADVEAVMGDDAAHAVKRRVVVNDVTPPKITSVAGSAASASVTVGFSEPLKPESVTPAAFTLEPAAEVAGATLSSDGQSVTLALKAPLEADVPCTLHVKGVADRSPRANTTDATALFKPVGPVFEMRGEIKRKSYDSSISDGRIPWKGAEPFTMNVWVRPETTPDNRTVIIGFGRCDDRVDGTGRYFAKFAGGAHFWSRMRDADSKSPLRVNQWQMLTAVYDGSSITLFHDGKKVGRAEVTLADDEPTVWIAPKDPWERVRQFRGAIRDFTVWATPLTPEAVAQLHDAGAAAVTADAPR